MMCEERFFLFWEDSVLLFLEEWEGIHIADRITLRNECVYVLYILRASRLHYIIASDWKCAFEEVCCYYEGAWCGNFGRGSFFALVRQMLPSFSTNEVTLGKQLLDRESLKLRYQSPWEGDAKAEKEMYIQWIRWGCEACRKKWTGSRSVLYLE
jgi:hypothetical protein